MGMHTHTPPPRLPTADDIRRLVRFQHLRVARRDVGTRRSQQGGDGQGSQVHGLALDCVWGAHARGESRCVGG